MAKAQKSKEQSETSSILPEEVSKKYVIPEGVLSKFVCEFGIVDLRFITPDFADRLAEKGYLLRI